MKKQLIDKEKAGAAVMAGFNKSDCLHRLNLVKNEDAILTDRLWTIYYWYSRKEVVENGNDD